MKTTVKIIFGVLALALFVLPNAATARGVGKSAETIVVCGFGALPGVLPAEYGGLYTVLGHSTPSAVDTGQCRFGETPDLCTTCILSLESQRCKVVETVADNFGDVKSIRSGGMTTYLISCSQP